MVYSPTSTTSTNFIDSGTYPVVDNLFFMVDIDCSIPPLTTEIIRLCYNQYLRYLNNEHMHNQYKEKHSFIRPGNINTTVHKTRRLMFSKSGYLPKRIRRKRKSCQKEQ